MWATHACLNVHPFLVWTEESWLQKYANAEDETKEEATATEVKSDDDDEEEEEKTPKRNAPSQGGRSRVFLDIQIGGSLAGRIEIELRGDVVPKTAGKNRERQKNAC